MGVKFFVKIFVLFKLKLYICYNNNSYGKKIQKKQKSFD